MTQFRPMSHDRIASTKNFLSPNSEPHGETVSLPLDLNKEADNFITARDHLTIKRGPGWRRWLTHREKKSRSLITEPLKQPWSEAHF